MKKVVSSGGVVIKKANGKVQVLLIIFPGGHGLGFPKGHVEDSESVEEAALREVFEETGLKNIKIIKKLGVVTRPAIEDDGTKVTKSVHLFLMKTSNYNHSKAVEEYGWFTIDQAIKKMSFPQEAEFLKKIKKELE